MNMPSITICLTFIMIASIPIQSSAKPIVRVDSSGIHGSDADVEAFAYSEGKGYVDSMLNYKQNPDDIESFNSESIDYVCLGKKLASMSLHGHGIKFNDQERFYLFQRDYIELCRR